MSNVREELLTAAEGRIRRNGFHGVSFRDLAGDLGIKSASVHYHFPKKEDLGVSVVERYAERLFGALEDRVAGGVPPVQAFVDTYRSALNSADAACLCGVMGAEVLGLPEPVQAAVRSFLKDNIRWLSRVLKELGAADPEAQATEAVATLQGAMMLAVNLGDKQVFEVAANGVEQRLGNR